MGASGPLDQPKLRAIDEHLDARDLDQAAALLAELHDVALFSHATSYLTTRLLFLRGRLDIEGVVQRLVEVLREVEGFPEAQAMLDAAYSGELSEFGTAPKLRAAKHARKSQGPDERPSDPAHDLSHAAIVHTEDSTHPLGADEPDIDSNPIADDLSVTPDPDVHAHAPPDDADRLPPAPPLPRIAGAPLTAHVSADTSGENREKPAWVIESPRGRTRPRHASLPVPELPPSKLPPHVAQVLDQVAPRATSALDSELSADLHTASLHVSSRPPPNLEQAPAPPPDYPPERRDQRQFAPAAPNLAASDDLSLGSTAAPSLGSNTAPSSAPPPAPDPGSSSLSDGSVRPPPPSPSSPPVAAGSGDTTSRLSYDLSRSKSNLPPRAGIYSAGSSDRAAEHLQPPPSAAARPAAPRSHEERPATVRSVPPPAAGPSLFELASWLDAGEAQRVIDEVDASSASPELRLMRCRALVAAGALAVAREELSSLGATPLLEPELRGALARLLIDLGAPAEALAQASRACAEDPMADGARIALAWALVRLERRTGDAALLPQARDALAALNAQGNRYAALVLALKACIQASIGESDKAIAIAQRAIGLDANSVDATAALALGAARLGQFRDAQQAWCRVLDLDHQEADALSDTLVALGVDLQQALPGPAQSVETAEPVWHALELHLGEGSASGLGELEQHAQRHIERVTANPRTPLQVLATLSAGYLNTAPCFRNFAPFDISLRSIRQLEAALLASYGHQPRPDLNTDHWALTLTLGSYVGEVLRQVHAGRWTGSLEDAVHARVLARSGTWEPLRQIQARLLGGSSHDLTLALRSAFPPGNSKEWNHRVPIAVLPATPWAGTWPNASEAIRLGAALKTSVVSNYLERLGVGALDGSYADFARLDRYLDLLAPAHAPSFGDDTTRRACGLLGCHVGEIVRADFGGQWVDQGLGLPAAAGPERTALVLDSGLKLEPLRILAERLGPDRKFSLQEWHQTLSLAR